MPTIIDTLITKVKFDTDTSGLETATKGVADFAVKAAAAVTAAFVGGAGLLKVINDSTREMTSLAEAVGLTTREFQAYGMVAKQLGMDADVVIDLVEEMNNKLGESVGLGEATMPVVESLQMLGLTLEEIKNLDSAAQFEKISAAILKLPDAQQAASAADILFGGEANKFFGHLKATGKSLDQILLQYSKMNFLTEKGIDGAKRYAGATDGLAFGLGTFGREIAGVLGGILVPVIESVTEAFAGFAGVLGGILVPVIESVPEAFAGFIRFIQDNQQFLTIFAGLMTALAVAYSIYSGAALLAAKATWAFVSALAVPLGVAAAIIIMFAATALAVDDLIQAFSGGKSVIGDFFKEFFGIDLSVKFDEAKASVLNLWEFIKSMFTAEFWSNIWDGMLDSFVMVVDKIVAIFSNLGDFITDKVSSFGGGIADFFGFGDSSPVPVGAGGASSSVSNRNTNVGNVTVNVTAAGADADTIAKEAGGAFSKELRNSAQDFDSEIQR